jgi:choline transport protein
MSEEIKNASVVVPRSIMTSMALNGALGFAILLAAVYALGNIDDVLSSPTGLAGYSFLDILRTGVGSVGGAAGMGAVIIFMQIFGNVADMAAASRMLWAFSRDKAVPGWSFFVQVSFTI